jgi:hypothetical protein
MQSDDVARHSDAFCPHRVLRLHRAHAADKVTGLIVRDAARDGHRRVHAHRVGFMSDCGVAERGQQSEHLRPMSSNRYLQKLVNKITFDLDVLIDRYTPQLVYQTPHHTYTLDTTPHVHDATMS